MGMASRQSLFVVSFCILQQPWCIAVLTDIIMVTKISFSSECSLEESGPKDR